MNFFLEGWTTPGCCRTNWVFEAGEAYALDRLPNKSLAPIFLPPVSPVPMVSLVCLFAIAGDPRSHRGFLGVYPTQVRVAKGRPLASVGRVFAVLRQRERVSSSASRPPRCPNLCPKRVALYLFQACR